ncbi:hypothetical protein CA13_60880 [Planctomycetes bacterium CA13]|uniref:Uncharacterized protein n=1 Tax=Novipirellula herctigrandis TaxID=2527986 RepID=A0A5C5ZBU8_9BACT|nr:hypothetical protein CA13_60880 [Planctomycetes bacterium CA13]
MSRYSVHTIETANEDSNATRSWLCLEPMECGSPIRELTPSRSSNILENHTS